MKNKSFKSLMIFLMLLMLPILVVNAETEVNVKNQDELKNALSNSEVNTINITENIETTEKINVTRPVTINGNNHTVKYVGTFGSSQSTDNTVWGGIYIFQIYKTSATIKNIKLTGGNAGLLINGSDVKFVGTIDVSGNGFGGIELGQGKGVTENNKLSLNENAKIVNTTETGDRPTLWVPDDSEAAILVINGIAKTIQTGEELTIDEIEDMFGLDDELNPQTSDDITLYLLLGATSVIGLGFITKQVVKKDWNLA